MNFNLSLFAESKYKRSDEGLVAGLDWKAISSQNRKGSRCLTLRGSQSLYALKCYLRPTLRDFRVFP